MFLMNVESLMPGVQNLWSEVKLFLLSDETLPVLLISNAVTVVLMCVMSVEKCAYLFVLSMFRCEMFTSRGTVKKCEICCFRQSGDNDNWLDINQTKR